MVAANGGGDVSEVTVLVVVVSGSDGMSVVTVTCGVVGVGWCGDCAEGMVVVVVEVVVVVVLERVMVVVADGDMLLVEVGGAASPAPTCSSPPPPSPLMLKRNLQYLTNVYNQNNEPHSLVTYLISCVCVSV